MPVVYHRVIQGTSSNGSSNTGAQFQTGPKTHCAQERSLTGELHSVTRLPRGTGEDTIGPWGGPPGRGPRCTLRGVLPVKPSLKQIRSRWGAPTPGRGARCGSSPVRAIPQHNVATLCPQGFQARWKSEPGTGGTDGPKPGELPYQVCAETSRHTIGLRTQSTCAARLGCEPNRTFLRQEQDHGGSPD